MLLRGKIGQRGVLWIDSERYVARVYGKKKCVCIELPILLCDQGDLGGAIYAVQSELREAFSSVGTLPAAVIFPSWAITHSIIRIPSVHRSGKRRILSSELHDLYKDAATLTVSLGSDGRSDAYAVYVPNAAAVSGTLSALAALGVSSPRVTFFPFALAGCIRNAKRRFVRSAICGAFVDRGVSTCALYVDGVIMFDSFRFDSLDGDIPEFISRRIGALLSESRRNIGANVEKLYICTPQNECEHLSGVFVQEAEAFDLEIKPKFLIRKFLFR